MADLKDLRSEIDRIDAELIRLFLARVDIAEQVAAYKIENGMEVLDAKREEEKLREISSRAERAFDEVALRELFRQLMAISRKRQYQILRDRGITDDFRFEEQKRSFDASTRVVWQGRPGAYSEAAAQCFFGDAPHFQNVDSFSEAVQCVETGEADYCVLPIENSTAGGVADIYELLLTRPVYIVGEQIIKVEHRLLGLEAATLDDIERVYSHPQALAQCSSFLGAHPAIRQIEMDNTARAAAFVAESGDVHAAAIASDRAASHYGLVPLTEVAIAHERNATRFVVLHASPCFFEDAKKISICFELPHACGTLYQILSHFIFNGLNMTGIASRPIAGRDFEYRFFVDFEGRLADAAVQNALLGIGQETADLRILGNY